MCVPGVRSRVKAEGVSEVEAAKEKAYSAIAEPQPENVRYASNMANDGATFGPIEKQEEPLKKVPT